MKVKVHMYLQVFQLHHPGMLPVADLWTCVEHLYYTTTISATKYYCAITTSVQHYQFHSPQLLSVLPDSFLLHQYNLRRKPTQAQIYISWSWRDIIWLIYKTQMPTFLGKAWVLIAQCSFLPTSMLRRMCAYVLGIIAITFTVCTVHDSCVSDVKLTAEQRDMQQMSVFFKFPPSL